MGTCKGCGVLKASIFWTCLLALPVASAVTASAEAAKEPKASAKEPKAPAEGGDKKAPKPEEKKTEQKADETLTAALEQGKKDKKPVLLYVHRGDWVGIEKFEEGIKKMLGDGRAAIVWGYLNNKSCEESVKSYSVKKLDGGMAMLDPLCKNVADQVISRLEAQDGKAEGEFKKFVTDGVAAFKDRQSARDAISKMWDVVAAGDSDENLAKFKAVLWPTQVKELGDEKLKKTFKEGVSAAKKCPTIAFTSVKILGGIEKYTKQDATIKTAFKVNFDMVKVDGTTNDTSFTVVQTADGFFVEWAS